MSGKLSVFLAFATGGAVGALAARQYFSEKYRRIAQEEIDSVKALFPRKKKRVVKVEPVDENDDAAVQAEKYTDYTKYYDYKVEQTTEVIMDGVPIVISPSEFGDEDDYEQISLTYYADGVLADDNDVAMDPAEIEKTVGSGFLDHFGEYEDDSVFIRNERLKCDYEILLNQRPYSTILKEKPYIQEG